MRSCYSIGLKIPPRPSGSRRRRLAALATTQLFVFFSFGELMIRVTDVDMALLRPLLYYQAADLPFHRPSDDPKLLYELRPNFAMTLQGRKISINSLGFRDKERSVKKPRGVFRIVCLGSSNTYGAAVNDDETYPAYLEAVLNKRAPGRYEVWNAGISAYVLAQSTAWAEEIARKYEPDLIIFQYYNVGRKPFLLGYPYSRYFDADPSLYLENLRYLPFSSRELDLALLRRWRLFRAGIILLNRWDAVASNNPFYNNQRLDFSEFENFYLTHERTTHLVDFSIDPDPIHADPFQSLGLKTVFLRDHVPPGAPPEYLKVHPPAYVYRRYAEILISALRKEGLLPR
jgi:hypothetical protein